MSLKGDAVVEHPLSGLPTVPVSRDWLSRHAERSQMTSSDTDHCKENLRHALAPGSFSSPSCLPKSFHLSCSLSIGRLNFESFQVSPDTGERECPELPCRRGWLCAHPSKVVNASVFDSLIRPRNGMTRGASLARRPGCPTRGATEKRSDATSNRQSCKRPPYFATLDRLPRMRRTGGSRVARRLPARSCSS